MKIISRAKELQIYNEGYYDGYGFALSEMNAKKWIPVSVLLPSKDGEYFVTVEYDDCGEKKKTVGIFDWRGGCFKPSFIFINVRVTAWMPLPEPFEEEEK